MAYTKYYFFMLLVTLVGLSSCNKVTEPEIVPATATGENTMGFYVDGKLVNIIGEYDDGGIFNGPYGVSGTIFEESTIHIFGSSKEPSYSLKINVPNDSVNSLGEYRLYRSYVQVDEVVFIDDGDLGGNLYETSDEYDGMIKFTRRDEHVISGTFEFDAFSKENGQVISVTEGRFDIKR